MVSHRPKMAFFDNPYYDYKGAEFMSVNVPMFLAKPMIKRALREDGENEELVNLIRKVSDVKVLTVRNGNSELLTDFNAYLTKNNFEEWITIKKEKETLHFQAKQKKDLIRNLLITVRSGSELVFVDVSGKFSPDDISRIINYSEKNDVRKIAK